MGKIVLVLLGMLVISAISMSVQAQPEQSSEPATTTATTTTGDLSVTTTTTTTDNGIILYDESPAIKIENTIPVGKAHIKITKQSDGLKGYIYKILIEDANQEPPLFVPNEIVTTFSVDNNVYIVYDDIKIQYKTAIGNYASYKPNPCNTKFLNIIKSVEGLHPAIGVLWSFYDIFSSSESYFGECLNPSFNWGVIISADENKIYKKDYLPSSGKIEKNIINSVIGMDEEERNNRHVETLVYSADPILEMIAPSRSIIVTIPVKPKDIKIDGDIRVWIDIRGYLSLTKDLSQIKDISKLSETAASNMVGSLIPLSAAMYFENKNIFKKDVLIAENPSNKDLHTPVLSDPKVVPDCGQENSDEFEFSVVYRDEDGDNPVEANVAIRGYAFDGTEYVFDKGDYNRMEKVSGDSKQGAVYSFKRQLPEKGEYHYAFYFTNSKGVTVRLPEQNFGDNYGLPGPIVGKECGTQEKEVIFPDPNLEAAIRAAINKPEGAIYATDLEGLKGLDASEKNIKDITGLNYSTNLKKLILAKNNITDLSPLSGLENLEVLSLYDNKITDISPLSRLIKLKDLDLSSVNGYRFFYPSEGNHIIDLSSLSLLKNLEILCLDGNPITDLSPLSELNNLKRLYISSIGGFTPKGESIVKGNQITDLSPLSGLIKLESLHLGGMSDGDGVTDISPLSGLKNLESLSITNYKIKDISLLYELKNLESLDLRWNMITDVSSLSGLTKLQDLYLSANKIADVLPLSRLTNLEKLIIEKNQIAFIPPLSELRKLESLFISNNQITDISSLSELKNLRYLDAEDNQIIDISPLSGLKNLENLNLKNNKVTDVSSLSGLTKLINLYLNDNQITDVSPLSGLTCHKII
jgi:internalin A